MNEVALHCVPSVADLIRFAAEPSSLKLLYVSHATVLTSPPQSCNRVSNAATSLQSLAINKDSSLSSPFWHVKAAFDKGTTAIVNKTATVNFQPQHALLGVQSPRIVQSWEPTHPRIHKPGLEWNAIGVGGATKLGTERCSTTGAKESSQ
jgi:hypothetical protein